MEKQNTSLCVCISIHVHAVPVFLRFVIVLCLCECAEEGREKTMEGTSTSNSLFGSLSVFDSERGSNRKGRGYHCRLYPGWPLSTQCVYTRGKNIVQRMWLQLWDRKDKGAL